MHTINILVRWLMKFSEEKHEPRELKVPSESIIAILEAWDSYKKAEKSGGGAVEHYYFWCMAEQVLPEIKEGTWTFYTSCRGVPSFHEFSL